MPWCFRKFSFDRLQGTDQNSGCFSLLFCHDIHTIVHTVDQCTRMRGRGPNITSVRLYDRERCARQGHEAQVGLHFDDFARSASPRPSDEPGISRVTPANRDRIAVVKRSGKNVREDSSSFRAYPLSLRKPASNPVDGNLEIGDICVLRRILPPTDERECP